MTHPGKGTAELHKREMGRCAGTSSERNGDGWRQLEGRDRDVKHGRSCRRSALQTYQLLSGELLREDSRELKRVAKHPKYNNQDKGRSGQRQKPNGGCDLSDARFASEVEAMVNSNRLREN